MIPIEGMEKQYQWNSVWAIDNDLFGIEIVSYYRRLYYTPTPWLTLLLVLGQSHVKQNLC